MTTIFRLSLLAVRVRHHCLFFLVLLGVSVSCGATGRRRLCRDAAGAEHVLRHAGARPRRTLRNRKPVRIPGTRHELLIESN